MTELEVATGPRYPMAVEVSAGPVVVARVICCGDHLVPIPAGPIRTVAAPPEPIWDWATPFPPIGAALRVLWARMGGGGRRWPMVTGGVAVPPPAGVARG